jgi:L-iditol 2-dehydrogenase
MKGLVKYAKGYGCLELREIPKPTVGENEVLVQIKAAGICGSDLLHFEVGDQVAVPAVLGHEFSGDIVAIGSKVKGWQKGERIVSETHAQVCHECYWCKTGDYHLCKERKGFGASVDGAFTQYIAVPADLLHRIPDSISYPEATVLQPAADVVHSVITNTNVRPSDSVVVIGPGPMGLLSVQVSRVCGAGKVIVVGLDTDIGRMEIAQEMGADGIINASKEDAIEKVTDLTDGRGAEVVLEVSGSQSGFLQGLKMLSRKGQLTIIGVPTKPVEIVPRALQLGEQSIKGSTKSVWLDYERAIQLTRTGRLKLKPLVSHVLPLSEWEKGFDLALTKQACKVVFTPIG